MVIFEYVGVDPSEWNGTKKREMFMLQRQHLFAIPSITMGCFTVGKIFSCMHN